MKIECVLKSRGNVHYAKGIYDTENKSLTVLRGSKIALEITFNAITSKALQARKDTNIVDSYGNVLTDVSFSSASTAAQFVTGRSSNGYIAWRPSDKMNLKEYLSKQERGIIRNE